MNEEETRLIMGLSIGPARVYLALKLYLSPGGQTCYPSVITLCGDTGLSRRGVQKALDGLVAVGLVTKKPDTKRSTNLYLLPKHTILGAEKKPVDGANHRSRGGEPPFAGGRTTVRGGANHRSPEVYVKDLEVKEVKNEKESSFVTNTQTAEHRVRDWETTEWRDAEDYIESEIRRFLDAIPGNKSAEKALSGLRGSNGTVAAWYYKLTWIADKMERLYKVRWAVNGVVTAWIEGKLRNPGSFRSMVERFAASDPAAKRRQRELEARRGEYENVTEGRITIIPGGLNEQTMRGIKHDN